jgi:hypothetical protein
MISHGGNTSTQEPIIPRAWHVVGQVGQWNWTLKLRWQYGFRIGLQTESPSFWSLLSAFPCPSVPFPIPLRYRVFITGPGSWTKEPWIARSRATAKKRKQNARRWVCCNPVLFSHQGLGVFSSFGVAANYYLRITILGLWQILGPVNMTPFKWVWNLWRKWWFSNTPLAPGLMHFLKSCGCLFVRN